MPSSTEKLWRIVAYPEENLPRQEICIFAASHDEAKRRAWRLFPYYHETAAFEVHEKES